MEELIKELTAAKTEDQCSELEKKYKETFPSQLRSYDDEQNKKLDKLLLAVVYNGHDKLLELIANRILEKRKGIDWKSRTDVINSIVDTVKEGCVANRQKGEHEKYYLDFMKLFVKTIKSNRLEKQHFGKLFEIIELAFKTKDPDADIHKAAQPIITESSWNENLPYLAKATQQIVGVVKAHVNSPGNAWIVSITESLLNNGYSGLSNGFVIKSNSTIPKNPNSITNVPELYAYLIPTITELFKFCASQEWTTEEVGKKNICHTALNSLMTDVLNNGKVDPAVLKPIMKEIVELWTCGDEIMERDAGYIIVTVTEKDPLLVIDQLDTLLDMFLAGNLVSLMSSLDKMYEEAPEKFEKRIDALLDLMLSDDILRVQLAQLATTIAKRAIHVIKPEHIQAMVELYKYEDLLSFANSFLEVVSAKKLDEVLKHESTIINAVKKNAMSLSLSASLITKLATNQSRVKAYLELYAKELQSSTHEGININLIYTMKSIGGNYPELLRPHKALLESLKNKPALRDICQMTLDVIEGRSLNTVSTEVEQQKKSIKLVNDKVDKTETKVQTMSDDVKDTKTSMKQIKATVQTQKSTLMKLENTVETTVQKVEVIDKKTLSHAPAWSPTVSKLLNSNAEHDWKSLATRLGYSNDDIRNWATQPDPCLSLLDDWFATHKTREATYAVYNVLLDINRTDAAALVDEALKSAQNVVLDNDDQALVEAQPVFLSYQWAHQQQVKLVRQHLSLAGYSAWMDVGQMGGGDKLFSKIDAALRAAKVVVCCVTDKYAQSTNCNREVTLAVTLGKPIIPLLLEDIKWPPSGALGPIFSEYLYIQFFKRTQDTQNKTVESTTAAATSTFWPEAKFSELLMQLRYTHSPNTKLITPESPYKNWWQPPDEITVVKSTGTPSSSAKSRLHSTIKSSGTASTKGADSSTKAACDVFISYQWDVQPHVKLLYRRLTQLGYTCWLDIMQMGGGDSLFDKIDRGMRSCRVVLSCVTSKYALSANCRREVSLADVLKKPIIPLLLEEIQWPPEGPMGPVFAQLLYIDFSKDLDGLTQKKSQKFDELISKLEVFNGSSDSRVAKQQSVLKSNASKPTGGNQKLPNIAASNLAGQRSYGSTKKN